MPVRVLHRFPQMGRDRLFEPRRNGVLQRIGFRINFAPIEAEHARQKQLDEPMPADPACLGNARVGELHPLADAVLDQARRLQPLEHSGHRRRLHFEPRRDSTGDTM